MYQILGSICFVSYLFHECVGEEDFLQVGFLQIQIHYLYIQYSVKFLAFYYKVLLLHPMLFLMIWPNF